MDMGVWGSSLLGSVLSPPPCPPRRGYQDPAPLHHLEALLLNVFIYCGLNCGGETLDGYMGVRGGQVRLVYIQI